MIRYRNEKVQQRLEECLVLAKKLGPEAEKSLKDSLDFLSNYSNSKTVQRTYCMLGWDFAPNSFSFDMFLVGRTYRQRKGKCPNCSFEWAMEAGNELTQCVCGGTLEHGEWEEKTVEERWYFNGGLVYFGPMENGVDAPQYSVTLNPTRHAKWEVHT